MKILLSILLIYFTAFIAHAQSVENPHADEISALKAEVSRLAAGQQILQQRDQELDSKITKVDVSVKPTDCRWTDWRHRGDLETNLNCWENHFVQGVGFIHKHGENLTFQESFRLLCCKIKG